MSTIEFYETGSNTDTTKVGADDPLPTTSFSPTLTVPVQITKTVAAIATPEALAANNTLFQIAIIMGKNGARTDNTTVAYLGIGSGNDAQAYAIQPGQTYSISAPVGQKFDLNDWYLDVTTAADGVIIIYS